MGFFHGEIILMDNLEMEILKIKTNLKKLNFFQILKKSFLFIVEMLFVLQSQKMGFFHGEKIVMDNLEMEKMKNKTNLKKLNFFQILKKSFLFVVGMNFVLQ